jgi:hypothetical protein
MTLLSEASFLVTPNGYKEDKLYAAIPTNGNGDMTVTRATTATRVNEAGLVELVPYNLLSRSEDFANAVWSKIASSTVVLDATVANPTGILSTYKYTASNLSFGGILRQPATITTATTYTLSFFVKKGNHSFVGIRFNTAVASGDRFITYNFDTDTINQQGVTATAVASRELFANGWVRFILVYTSTSSAGTCDIAITNSSGSTPTALTGTEYMYVYGAQLVEGSSALTYQKTVDRLDIPRIDYTGGGCPSILLEPQRTNIVLRSEEFDNASFQKSLSSVSANTTTAPDGTLTADTWTGDGTLGVHFLAQVVSGTSGVAYTQSVFAKKGTNNFLQILGTTAIYDANSWANFDLENGVVGSSGASATATITDFGNGWYRCTMTATATATASGNGFLLYLITSATSARIEINSLATSVHLWGAQLEAGAYPTSYIPTTTATVTRLKDECTNGGNADLFNDSEGVLFLDVEIPNNSSEVKQTSLNNGTTSEAVKILQLNGTTFRFEVVMSSGTNFSQDITVSPYQRNKLALQYKANDYKVFVNGVKQTVTQRSTLPTGLDRFNFNRGFSTTDDFSGKVNQLMIFNEALSDSELQTLTTL